MRSPTRSPTPTWPLLEEAACPTCGSCSGMFTANSMNCLTEALGLALPGNGSTLATHTARTRALPGGRADGRRGRARATTTQDDESVLPRSIATRAAFENAITLDIAMGGSTNTVLHVLAAAHEAEVDFTMRDIDELSRRVPCLCKVAPNGTYLMEDVHRAGGIPAILGELRRGGLLREDVTTVHSTSVEAWLTDVGHPQRRAVRGGAGAVPRRARMPALGDGRLAVRALGVARHRCRRGLHP